LLFQSAIFKSQTGVAGDTMALTAYTTDDNNDAYTQQFLDEQQHLLDPATGQPLFKPVINTRSEKLATKAHHKQQQQQLLYGTTVVSTAAAMADTKFSTSIEEQYSAAVDTAAAASERLYLESVVRREKDVVRQAILYHTRHTDANKCAMR
jgi:hypothetical protein